MLTPEPEREFRRRRHTAHLSATLSKTPELWSGRELFDHCLPELVLCQSRHVSPACRRLIPDPAFQHFQQYPVFFSQTHDRLPPLRSQRIRQLVHPGYLVIAEGESRCDGVA